MILRILPIVLLAIIIADYYIYRHFIQRWRCGAVVRLLWFCQSLLTCAFTLYMAFQSDFIPEPKWIADAYLSLLFIWVVPKALFALVSAFGIKRRKREATDWCKTDSLACVIAIMPVVGYIYGNVWGFHNLKVVRTEYVSERLPKGFDGYRIAVISDAHVGSFYSKRGHRFLQQVADSVNALNPDIVFVLGDIVNMRPNELEPVKTILAAIKAPDGVFSVYGNHDYGDYTNADSIAKVEMEKDLSYKMMAFLGWRQLGNENVRIAHNGDTIAVVGMHCDNNPDDKPDFKGKNDADVMAAMAGVGDSLFTVLLQHNPKSWRRHVLPKTQPDLTLSGHTHGGQMALFGWSPPSIGKGEWYGWYDDAKGHSLYVTRGIGGLIPMRIGAPPEVVLITLNTKQ